MLLVPDAPTTLSPVRPLTARERQIIDDITRREFIIGGTALTALIAAGCGSEDADSAGGAGRSDLTSPDMRGVEVSLERPPARVVAVWDSIDAQLLIALGIEPVLIGRIGAGRPAPWVDDYTGLETYQFTETPNLELIAAAEPDLIVTALYDDRLYPQLEAIAPLFVVDNTVPWREALRSLAALVGKSDVAEDIIRRNEQAIASAATELAAWRNRSLLVAALSPGEEQLAVFTDRSPISALLEELGLAALTPAKDGSPTESYSFELLDELTGDAFLFADVSGLAGQDLSEFNEEFLADPIVATIPAAAGGIAPLSAPATAALRLVNAANLTYLTDEVVARLSAITP